MDAKADVEADYEGGASARLSIRRWLEIQEAGLQTYANTPTVVVVLVPLRGGLLMIRRALPGEGQGQLALPGGYQMLGQTWREAGAAEVREEAGVDIDPEALWIVAVETTPDRRQNLIFCESPLVDHDGAFDHDVEVSEVLIVREPVATAFPLHSRQVEAFFDRQSRPRHEDDRT